MGAVSCIVYDLDGTLIDSASDIASAVDRVREHYDLPPLGTAAVCEFIGDGAMRLLERAVLGLVEDRSQRPERVLPKSAVDRDEMLRLFKTVYAGDPVVETELYPGVERALKHWHREGAAQVVLTNKPHDLAVAVIEALHVEHYLDLIVGRGKEDDLGRPLPSKPDPAVIDHIVEETGADRSETWMVGDGPPDIEVARAAGIPCLVVLSGYYAPERLIPLIDDLDLAKTSFEAADEHLRGL